jgi:acyl-CoA reductase-like NAD-dependent aldehyde dehydrogenase
MIEIENYISNKFIKSENKQNIKDKLSINIASYWNIQSAIRDASIAQEKLAELDVLDIIKVLKNSLKYFKPSLDLISNIIGTDIDTLKKSRKNIDIWYENLEDFYFNSINKNVTYHPSAPVVCILPSNSDQEALFILTQTLLTKNAAIVRSSTKGVNSYVTLEFIKAINKSVDDFKNPKLNILKNAISSINLLSDDDYLNHLSVDGFNYILFGSNKNIKIMKSKIAAEYRKVFSYGTGLATTIIDQDANLEKYMNCIIDSIVYNSGNECICTKIIYIHPSKHEEFIKLFNKNAILKSKINESNIEFTKKELYKRGLIHHLKEEKAHSLKPTLIPLSIYDSAIEYPSPIASIRKIDNNLSELIEKDLFENDLSRNIATSIFSENNFDNLKKYSKAHITKKNIATHDLSLFLPHSGINLIEELLDKTYLQI